MNHLDCFNLLASLVQIPSVSREETRVADFLHSFILHSDFGKNHPTSVHRLENNIWLLQPNATKDKPTLLLNAHIDTVKPVAGWTRDPFHATVEGETLYGLGSNDCGGGLVSLLATFFNFAEKSLPFNLLYAATAEEEVSGKNGIELLLNHLRETDFFPSLAIVGEPTSLQMAVAEKGLMVLDCVAHGKSGHAARDEGVNAIYQALPDILWFQNHTWTKTSDFLGNVKTSVTMIDAGTQHNVVPDACRFVVDVRTTDQWTNTEALDFIRSNVHCDVTPRSTRLNPSGIDINHPLVQKALSLGVKLFGSPTLSDQALMPFPSVKLGPGDSARSHTADEFIHLSEIQSALSLYEKLITNN